MSKLGNINIADIIRQMQKAQEEANEANELRYQQGLAELTGARDVMRELYGEAGEMMGDVGRSAMEDISRGAVAAGGRGRQQLISSGLANTTIAANLMRGTEEDRRRAMERVEGQQATMRGGLATQRAGVEMAGGGAMADFIARRSDVGPDPALYGSLIQAAMAGGTGEPIRVQAGLGPMARAGLTGTGRPMGGGGGGGLDMGGGGAGYVTPSRPGTTTWGADLPWHKAAAGQQGAPPPTGGPGSLPPPPTGGLPPPPGSVKFTPEPGAGEAMRAMQETGFEKQAEQLTPEKRKMYERYKAQGWAAFIPKTARAAMGLG